MADQLTNQPDFLLPSYNALQRYASSWVKWGWGLWTKNILNDPHSVFLWCKCTLVDGIRVRWSLRGGSHERRIDCIYMWKYLKQKVVKCQKVDFKAKRFGLSPSSVAYKQFLNYTWQQPLRERKYNACWRRARAMIDTCACKFKMKEKLKGQSHQFTVSLWKAKRHIFT